MRVVGHKKYRKGRRPISTHCGELCGALCPATALSIIKKTNNQGIGVQRTDHTAILTWYIALFMAVRCIIFHCTGLHFWKTLTYVEVVHQPNVFYFLDLSTSLNLGTPSVNRCSFSKQLLCRQFVCPRVSAGQSPCILTKYDYGVLWLHALLMLFSIGCQVFWPPFWPRYCTTKARLGLWRFSALRCSWWRYFPVSSFVGLKP